MPSGRCFEFRIENKIANKKSIKTINIIRRYTHDYFQSRGFKMLKKE